MSNKRPLLDPAMNPNCFSNGRGVYEVEEEMLALFCNLRGSTWKRMLRRDQWRLWLLRFTYWPTRPEDVLENRTTYAKQGERAA